MVGVPCMVFVVLKRHLTAVGLVAPLPEGWTLRAAPALPESGQENQMLALKPLVCPVLH